MQRQRRNLKWQQKKVNTLRRHTGCCGAASGNGTGKRSDMWKSSGKVSHFFTGSSTGSGKILEVGSMGDWEYPHKMFQAFMSNQFADCRDTKCGLT